MKNLKYWQHRYLLPAATFTFLFSFLFISSNWASAKNNGNSSEVYQSIPYLSKGMYVIVGVFQIPENAKQYSNSIKIEGRSPRIGKIQKTKLYYVYAYTTKDDLEFAREKRSELRATREYYDAWIMYVGLNLEDLLKNDEEIAPEQIAVEQPKEIKSLTQEEEFTPSPPAQQDENLYNYRFSVINATTLKEVPGYITIIDAARNKAMKSVSTNQVHQIGAPKTQSKEIIAMCDIFGYVKEQAKFKINDPKSSADKTMISESGGITTVKYKLARHKVGEILTMYHVYFYTNAAIMKPESKFELNSLLAMLKENEKLKIKIHGHTNGNAAGKIIKLKEDDQTFFKVTSNNEESVGSAKELSKVRAETIMRWLAENGIDKKRMDLKGWGGKKMIYKKTESMAGKNVRVEIEILKG